MATKVTIIGEKEQPKELKPIVFKKYLSTHLQINSDPTNTPETFKYIELICLNFVEGIDLMFCYDDPNHRGRGVLYLGQFNDGVV